MITSVGGPKGGAGKSTVAINLAVSYARMGDEVMLVDADATNRSSIKWFALKSKEVSKRVSVCEATRPEILDSVINQLAGKYDHIVIDSPPTLKVMAAKIAMLSDYMVIPFYPGLLDYFSFNDFEEFFSECLLRRGQPLPASVLFNKQRTGLRRVGNFRDGIETAIAPYNGQIKLLERGMGDKNPYTDSIQYGFAVTHLAQATASAKECGHEWDRLFAEICEDINQRIFTDRGFGAQYLLDYDKYLAGATEDKDAVMAHWKWVNEELEALQQGNAQE